MDVLRGAEARLPTVHGEFRVIAYIEPSSNTSHLALISQAPWSTDAPLVRVHSECLTGDVFGSWRCDCGEQLSNAMQQIATEGGVVIYLRGHEGRGIGLARKIESYALQEAGLDTVDANVELGLPVDSRDYGIAATILDDLHINRIRLMTNNPHKPESLYEHGIEVIDRVPLESTPNKHNLAYLTTKRDRLGHLLEKLESC